MIRYALITTFLYLFVDIYCVTVIPERLEVVYTNEKYIDNVKAKIVRYGRKSAYYVNVSGRTKHTWNNNVTINIVFYEFLHNEYRRSFVEGHYKLCDMIKMEQKYYGKALDAYDFKCPLLAKYRRFDNMTASIEGFPYIFPFERARANITLTITDTSEVIFDGYFCCFIKPDKPKLKQGSLTSSLSKANQMKKVKSYLSF